MNNNLDETTMNNIKKMVDSGNINGAISQISPEMIQNFSKMFAQTQNNNSKTNNNFTSNNSDSSSFSTNTSSSNNSSAGFSQSSNNSVQNNFDLSGIDINAIMKLAGNMNTKNDPRNNLLNSLKPYLRDSKKDKLDNYINLLNMSKIAETLKNSQNNTKKDD